LQSFQDDVAYGICGASTLGIVCMKKQVWFPLGMARVVSTGNGRSGLQRLCAVQNRTNKKIMYILVKFTEICDICRLIKYSKIQCIIDNDP
jgi:hypothetical protein